MCLGRNGEVMWVLRVTIRELWYGWATIQPWCGQLKPSSLDFYHLGRGKC